jgi:type I site-specific restriction-modification system R (restriction) subunit
VPLYYDARGDKLGLAVGDLNARIAETLERLEIDDIDVAQRLERELKRDYHLMTRGQRLDQIARDFVEHYSAAWETGKAMLVCIDKVTCVRMHKLIAFYWHERIKALEAERAATQDEQQDAFLARQTQWMRETRSAVVVSEEQGEVARFQQWDLDITPHRKLMKEGMDLPTAMRAQPPFRNMQRMALDDAFKACINVNGANAHRADRDAINIVYQGLQRDRDRADISAILRRLHQVLDEAVETRGDDKVGDTAPYDISAIDFERLRREFAASPRKRTTVQDLKTAVEQRLQRMLQQNPLRTDFQRHYEQIVTDYNREKDRATIEQTFEDLLRFVKDLDAEANRAVREGLNEESLALFDLLRKPDLAAAEITRIKAVAADLLDSLKAERLRVDHWRDKEATRDAVRQTILDHLWSDATGLPVDHYSDEDVQLRADAVYHHMFRAYPVLPSPVYGARAAA